jgi:mannose-6-phosphate isomerase
VPDGLPWRQNPQMHWFEAMLALTETGARADGAMRAARHRTLFETVLCDPATRILGEYFDADWRPAPGDTGERVEPGHMAEWAWLLRRHEAIAGLERSSLPTVLLANALGYRDGGPGLLVDEGTRAGAILRGTRRIWPQTERVKAHLGEYQAGVPGAAAAAGAALDLLARHYLGRPFAAGWIDQLDVAGVAVPGPVPASILYHLYGIHAEAARWRATGVAG